jgi:ribosomal protein S27AE
VRISGAEGTLFWQRLQAYRKSTEPHTREGEASFGLGLTIFGTIGLVLFLLFPAFGAGLAVSLIANAANVGVIGIVVETLRSLPPVVFATLLVLIDVSFAAILLTGLYRLVSSKLKSTRPVTCPRCSHSVQIFSQVRTIICGKCGQPILLGQNPSEAVRLIPCNYCGLKTAVSSDCAPFDCPNCGVPRTGAADAPDGRAGVKCEACEAHSPRGALICTSCGAVDVPSTYVTGNQGDAVSYDRNGTLVKYGMDWIAGKDAIGHCLFARSLLACAREDVRLEAAGQIGLLELGSCHVALEGAMVSIEHAAAMTTPAVVSRNLLAQVDDTYGTLLKTEIDQLRAARSDDSLIVSQIMQGRQIYIQARRRLENLFSDAIPPGDHWMSPVFAEITSEDLRIRLEGELNRLITGVRRGQY